MRGCNRYRRMVFKSFLCAKGASRSLELRWGQAATSRTRFLWSSLRVSLALEQQRLQVRSPRLVQAEKSDFVGLGSIQRFSKTVYPSSTRNLFLGSYPKRAVSLFR
ncbi:unnamed protein product [Penicillium salamii]|nr:unnamed protein product [Penicillium salamii]